MRACAHALLFRLLERANRCSALRLQNSNFRQKSFEFNFTVSKLQASIYKSDISIEKPDKLLVEAILDRFSFEFAIRPYDMKVGITLGSFSIEDRMVEEGTLFPRLVSSDAHDQQNTESDLVRIKYAKVQPDSPEFMTVHEGNNTVGSDCQHALVFDV